MCKIKAGDDTVRALGYSGMEQRANSLGRIKVKWKQGEPFYMQVAFKHIGYGIL